MPVETPNVLCTPYVGRTVKGWTVRVRICITVTSAQIMGATFPDNLQGNNTHILPYLQALTSVPLVQLGGPSPVQEIAASSVDNDYDNAEDVLVLSFATQQGTVAKIQIPCPLPDIFLADSQTADITNEAVANFTTAMIGGTISSFTFYPGSTKSGAQLVSFLGGLRVRKKTRRKMSIWNRDASLVNPAI